MQRALSKTRPVRRVDSRSPDQALVVSLPSPLELRRRLPLPNRGRGRIDRTRRAIHDILQGHDPERLVVIVGPCSIHDRGSALVYAERLAEVAARHDDELVLVMRTYLEKPRSALGWKGFLNDPDLDGSCNAALGIELSRQLLLEIGALGVACASELLDPIAARYLEDLLSWTAIGARTALSQTHRELASGLPAPVGIKNGTDGDVEAAACGLPLVASRLSGIPELIRHDESGLLVEPGDSAGFASALARIATEPATRARLGAAAPERLEAEFCLERNVESLLRQIFAPAVP